MNGTFATVGGFAGYPASVPIFSKDLQILARYFIQIATVLIFGSFLLRVFMLDILQTGEKEDFLQSVFFSNVVFVPIIFALVAGTVVFAEESEHGTDWFLRRLPLSRGRLLTEKLGAGVLALVLVYLMAALAAWVNPFNAPLDDVDWLAAHVKVTVTMLSAYLFTVAASRYTSTVEGSILVAGMLEILMWMAYLQWDRWQAEQTMAEPLLRSIVAFLVLGASGVIITRGSWQLRLSPALWRRFPGPAMVWKGIAENSSLYGMALVLLGGELVHQLLVSREPFTGLDVTDENAQVIHGVVLLVSSMTIAALGTLSYTREERDGVSGLLYHHPVSRTRILAVKLLSAVPALFCLSLTNWIALAEPEVTFTRTLVVTGAAYCLGVFLGQVLGGRIIPLLAVYPAGVFIWLALYDWLGIAGQRWLFSDTLPFSDGVELYSVFFLIVTLIGLYCLAATWRLVTDIRFLTATTGYRYACFWVSVGVGFITISLLAQLLILLL